MESDPRYATGVVNQTSFGSRTLGSNLGSSLALTNAPCPYLMASNFYHFQLVMSQSPLFTNIFKKPLTASCTYTLFLQTTWASHNRDVREQQCDTPAIKPKLPTLFVRYKYSSDIANTQHKCSAQSETRSQCTLTIWIIQCVLTALLLAAERTTPPVLQSRLKKNCYVWRTQFPLTLWPHKMLLRCIPILRHKRPVAPEFHDSSIRVRHRAL